MNKIKLSGCINTEPTFKYEFFGEKFYEFLIEILRKSGKSDVIRCVVPEILKGSISQCEGVELIGEIRTRNYTREDETRGCEVFVFVTEVNEYSGEDVNELTVEGYICKEPNYRETPLGRQICDVLIASNRERSKQSDYIPCITWGRNALRVERMSVGTKIEIVGRLQSREYIKRLKDGAEETRVTYEVSAITVKEC